MASSPISTEQLNDNNGWEDEWESLETDPNVAKNTEKLRSYFPEQQDNDPFSSFQKKTNKVTEELPPTTESGDWNTDNWDSWESSAGTKKVESETTSESQLSKQEANRLAREEKRKLRMQQRQQGMQQRQPKKLGAQKLS
ncbi:unnamed protein product [Larinioides sclopetarius]